MLRSGAFRRLCRDDVLSGSFRVHLGFLLEQEQKRAETTLEITEHV